MEKGNIGNLCDRCKNRPACVEHRLLNLEKCKLFVDANVKCEPSSNTCKFDPASRYYDAGGIEVQEIIKAKLTPEQYKGFCLGNIIKYACRANFKKNFERDIEKVGFYQSFLNDETMEG